MENSNERKNDNEKRENNWLNQHPYNQIHIMPSRNLTNTSAEAVKRDSFPRCARERGSKTNQPPPATAHMYVAVDIANSPVRSSALNARMDQ